MLPISLIILLWGWSGEERIGRKDGGETSVYTSNIQHMLPTFFAKLHKRTKTFLYMIDY